MYPEALRAPRDRWIVPATQPRPAARRPRYLDATRGLFILLMISSHAITLAGVAAASFLQSTWWLPRGWSTAGFVMLAGFSVGVMTTRSQGLAPRAILKRAWHLLIVMVASNAILAVCRELVRGDAANFRDTTWIVHVITFQRDVTISGALFPIAAGLIIIAGLLAVSRRIRPAVLGLALVTLNVVAWIAQDGLAAGAGLPAGTQGWIALWLFSFPLVPLAFGAVTGFAIGSTWRSLAETIQIHSGIVGPLVLVSLVAMAPYSMLAPRPLFLTLNGAVQFGTILVLALSLAALKPLSAISNLLALLGRFSLMVFVLHRPLLHAADLCSRGLHLPAEARYLVMLIAGLGGSATLCLARQESVTLNRAMKRVLL